METQRCPDCGSPLSPEALDGMCPSCLAGLLGFDESGASRPQELLKAASSQTTDRASRWKAKADPVLRAKLTQSSRGRPSLASPAKKEVGQPRSETREKSGVPAPQSSDFGAGPIPGPLPTATSPRHRRGAGRNVAPDVILDVPGHIVTAEIARGGMGIVYRATQLEPRREVALKMLLASQVGIQHLRDHFLLEARAIARLDHPNILPIYHLGEYEGVPFFTMKLATAGSLHQRRTRYRAQWTLIAEHMAILADAVSYAHQRGVLHRDLKPGNVLFDESNRPYVTDFGLARVFEPGREVVAEGTHLVGTPRYMSPEVIAGGADAATTSSDVYALGLIFYELMAQRGPYDAANEHEHMRRVLDDPIPRPSKLMAGVPAELELLCLRCLESDRNRRLSSAAMLRDELRRWLAGKPMNFQELTRWDRWRILVSRHKLLTASSVLGGMGIALALGIAFSAFRSWRQFERERTQTLERDVANVEAGRLGDAQRLRYQGRIGQRAALLGALREAGAARPSVAARSEAVRELVQPNVGEEIARHVPGFEFFRSEAAVDLDLLAFLGPEGDLRVWRRSLSKQLWQDRILQMGPHPVLELSPNGQWLAAGGDENSVSIFETSGTTGPRPVPGQWLGFSGDGLTGVNWYQDQILSTALNSGKVLSQLALEAGPEVVAPPVVASSGGWSGIVVPRRESLELISMEGSIIDHLPWAGSAPTLLTCSSNRIIAADGSGIVRVWTLPHKSLLTLAGHSAPLRRLLVDPENRRLWTTGGGGETCWWDLTTGALLGRAPGWEPIQISADSLRMLVQNDRSISLVPIQPDAGRHSLALPVPEAVTHLEFGPGNHGVLTVQASSLTLWDKTFHHPVASVTCQAGRSAHFGARGDRVVLVQADQVRWFSVGDATNGASFTEFSAPVVLSGTSRRPLRTLPGNGAVLVVNDQSELLALDVDHGTVTTNLFGLSGIPPGALVAGEGSSKILAISSRALGTSVIPRAGHQPLFSLPERWGPLLFSPDGRSLLQMGEADHRLLDASTGRMIWTVPADPGPAESCLGVWPMAGQYLLIASSRGSIRLLRPETGVGVLDLEAPAGITSLTVNREGSLIASGGPTGVVSVWDLPGLERALKAVGQDLPFDRRDGVGP